MKEEEVVESWLKFLTVQVIVVTIFHHHGRHPLLSKFPSLPNPAFQALNNDPNLPIVCKSQVDEDYLEGRKEAFKC